MRAMYVPAGSSSPIVVELDRVDDLFGLSDSLQVNTGDTLPAAIELSDGSASSLLFARVGDVVALMICADDDHSYHWVDPTRARGDAGVVAFGYMGEYTEVPCVNTASLGQSQAIAAGYWHGGFTEALALGQWDLDW